MIAAFLCTVMSVAVGQVDTCPEPEAGLRPGPMEFEENFSQLGRLESELTGVYRQLRPSLVQVRVCPSPASEEHNAEPIGWNYVVSGVVLRETVEGCYIVVPGVWPKQEGAVQVVDLDGRIYDGKPLARRETYGLTLVEVNGLQREAPCFGMPQTMPVGSLTFGLGNPFGLDGTFTMGMLSGRGRTIGQARGLIQVTNPMNPGDGGGIIANSKGQLIAISLSSLRDVAMPEGSVVPDGPGLNRHLASGVSFAIPIHRVLRMFEDHLELPTEAARPRLGLEVQVAVIPPRLRRSLSLSMRTGLRVVVVEPGSPASASGLKADDFLLGVQGYPTEDFATLYYALRLLRTEANLLFLREDKLLNLRVQLPTAEELLQAAQDDAPRVQFTPPADEN
jgi:serine protease Do